MRVRSEHGTLAEALGATTPDVGLVWVHRHACPGEPCSCRPFAVPQEDLERLGAAAVAQKLAPFMEER